MKKLLLFSLLLCTYGLQSFAQVCTPVFDFEDEPYGVYPDTSTNFVSGQVGVSYSQQIDVKVPSDAGQIDPSFTGVIIDSAVVNSVNGLPDGLEFNCSMENCTYNGGEVGCGMVSGIPLVADTFEVSVTTTVYGSIFGTPLNMPLEFDGYKIIVEGTVGVTEFEKPVFALLTNVPNPANTKSLLRYTAPGAGQVQLNIFDLVGKQILSKNLNAVAGYNEYNLNTAALETGIYIYSINGFGQSNSRKLIVNH